MRGQLTVLGLIMGFMAIVVFIGLLPALSGIINQGLETADDFTDTILTLMIPMIAIGIIYSIWIYVVPHREARY